MSLHMQYAEFAMLCFLTGRAIGQTLAEIFSR
jgi:hypothetical protein